MKPAKRRLANIILRKHVSMIKMTMLARFSRIRSRSQTIIHLYWLKMTEIINQ